MIEPGMMRALARIGAFSHTILAGSVLVLLSACDGASGDADRDAIVEFIGAALQEKSQELNDTPRLLKNPSMRVSFYYSNDVDEELVKLLRQSLGSITQTPFQVATCGAWNELQITTEPRCPTPGTTIVVFVAPDPDRLRVLALEAGDDSTETGSLSRQALAVFDDISALAVQLKKSPPVCLYVRQPDVEQRISGGVVFVRTTESEDARICLLSSLYRIAGVEPFPNGKGDIHQSLPYLSTQEFGANPSTAIKFLYGTKHAWESKDAMLMEVRNWVQLHGN